MITFRTAKIEDIEEIMKIEKASFIPQIQENKDVFVTRIKQNSELFLLFYYKEEIAAYLSAEFMENLPEQTEQLALGHKAQKNPEKNYIYISSFALLPEFRGKGNGKLCFLKSLEYFNKNWPESKLLLLVNEIWKGALKIYTEAGFKKIQTFNNFFPSQNNIKTNGILMEKLNQSN